MLIPEDYAQINHFFTGPPIPLGAQVTYGVSLNVFGGDASDAAAAAYAAFQGSLLGRMNSGVTMTGVLCKFGPNDTGPSGEFSGAATGGVAGTAEGPQVSVLITKTTDLGGRQGKGRMFIPAISETQINTGGVMETAARAAMQTEANDFFAALITANLPMVLLRAETSPILAPILVNSLEVQTRVATQRRRNRR
jgi:hypothetical protein